MSTFAEIASTPEAAAFEKVNEQEEAAWDCIFEDVEKVTAFTCAVDASLVCSRPRPLDPACL